MLLLRTPKKILDLLAVVGFNHSQNAGTVPVVFAWFCKKPIKLLMFLWFAAIESAGWATGMI